MKFTSRWELPGLGTMYQVEDHEFDSIPGPAYAYGSGAMNDQGVPKVGEFFGSLDRALVAMVGEKYTGPRGAGGTGVGTAADWFCRMVGMDQLVEPDYADGRKAMLEAVAESRREDGPLYRRARAITEELEKRGVVLAVRVHT